MKNTLKLNREFLRLYKKGKSQVSPLLVTYVMPNRLGRARIGITASTKIGGAVQRNRARRVIRAAWQELSKTTPGGWDIVFVARTRTVTCRSTDLQKVMDKHLHALLPSKQGPK